jgi:Zn-dependent peptidase ImmA (M78 family)
MEPTIDRIAVPLRRADILRIARETRERYDSHTIDSVAKSAGIVLVRMSGPMGRDAGFAYIEYTRRPLFIESLSHPEEPIRLWGASAREPVRSIVINTNSGIPEREVFWHEFYHLFHSPHALQRSERFEHRFSTEGALHSPEERRADEFAVAILVPSLKECQTSDEIAVRFDISERLAKRAIQFYSAIGK